MLLAEPLLPDGKPPNGCDTTRYTEPETPRWLMQARPAVQGSVTLMKIAAGPRGLRGSCCPPEQPLRLAGQKSGCKPVRMGSVVALVCVGVAAPDAVGDVRRRRSPTENQGLLQAHRLLPRLVKLWAGVEAGWVCLPNCLVSRKLGRRCCRRA